MRLTSLALFPLILSACAVSTGTPTNQSASPSPSNSYTDSSDNSADDDLTLLSFQPKAESVFLPPALQMVTRFSEPFLGDPSDIYALFGPTCDSGAPLKNPTFNEDRTEMTYTLFGPTGETFCFSLEMTLNDEGAYVSDTTDVNMAPCGVTFDIGYEATFVEVSGETAGMDTLNQALSQFSFPMALSFADATRSSSFPFQTNCAIARILRIYTEDLEASGQWASDPALGASEMVPGCGINDMGGFVLRSPSLTLPIELQAGGIIENGSLLDYGEVYPLTLLNAYLSTTVSASGSFAQMGKMQLEGAVSQADLIALASASGDSEIEQLIARLTPDVDSNGDGSEDSFSVVMTSNPRLISLMGCDPATY